jgi:hypothetical protein
MPSSAMVGIAKIRNATATDNESSDIEAAAFWAIAAQTEEGVKRCKHLLLTKPPLEWHFIDNRSTRFSPRCGDNGLCRGQSPQASVATDVLADRLQPVGIGLRTPVNQIDVRHL